jgi:hypothetical protein
MSQIVTVKDLAGISLICPQQISNICLMNTQYNHIYLTDKSEQYVSKLPNEQLELASKGLEIIKDDEFVTIWDCEQYLIFAIKA